MQLQQWPLKPQNPKVILSLENERKKLGLLLYKKQGVSCKGIV